MAMMRVENWDTELVMFAREVCGAPFEWGTTDCATIMRRGLIATLGTDPLKGRLGSWTTRAGALRAFNRIAFSPAITLSDSGARTVGEKFAWSGDVAVGEALDDNRLPAIALLLPGRKALVSTPELGVIIVDRLSLTQGTTFWRYGVE